VSVGDSQDKGSPVLLLMTCGDIFRIIIALFIPLWAFSLWWD
jgi:hypothetical protein